MKTGIAFWMREFCWTQNSQVGALENTATKDCMQPWSVAGEEREAGFKQFLDDKTYKPGLGMYKRPPKK